MIWGWSCNPSRFALQRHPTLGKQNRALQSSVGRQSQEGKCQVPMCVWREWTSLLKQKEQIKTVLSTLSWAQGSRNAAWPLKQAHNLGRVLGNPEKTPGIRVSVLQKPLHVSHVPELGGTAHVSAQHSTAHTRVFGLPELWPTGQPKGQISWHLRGLCSLLCISSHCKYTGRHSPLLVSSLLLWNLYQQQEGSCLVHTQTSKWGPCFMPP